MRRFFSSLITLPITLLAVIFAVNNRGPVMLDLWPFGISIQAPLYLLFLGTLLFGFAFGALTTWFSQHRHRTAKKQLAKRLADCEKQLAEARTALTAADDVLSPPAANTNTRSSVIGR